MHSTEVQQPHWKDVLKFQGRSIKWLAAQTGRSQSLVYQYSNGQLPPTEAWLVRASAVLGVQVRG